MIHQKPQNPFKKSSQPKTIETKAGSLSPPPSSAVSIPSLSFTISSPNFLAAFQITLTAASKPLLTCEKVKCIMKISKETKEN